MEIAPSAARRRRRGSPTVPEKPPADERRRRRCRYVVTVDVIGTRGRDGPRRLEVPHQRSPVRLPGRGERRRRRRRCSPTSVSGTMPPESRYGPRARTGHAAPAPPVAVVVSPAPSGMCVARASDRVSRPAPPSSRSLPSRGSRGPARLPRRDRHALRSREDARLPTPATNRFDEAFCPRELTPRSA